MGGEDRDIVEKLLHQFTMELSRIPAMGAIIVK
jgi:hypothetical protein